MTPGVHRILRSFGLRWLAVELTSGILALLVADLALLLFISLFAWGAVYVTAVALAFAPCAILAVWALRLPREVWGQARI